MFFIYILGPDTKRIFIYPSPENVNSVLFKDVADSCFSFKPVEVECPKDESKISSVPVQTLSSTQD
jgi:hypothetical protein